MTSLQATILACVAVVCFSVLVALDKIHVSEAMVNTAFASAASFFGGLVIKRPDAVRKALGLPVDPKEDTSL